MMPTPSDNPSATPRVHVSVCTCPDLNVTTWLDLQEGRHTFAKGWTSDCPTHGYEGTNPTYRKVVLSDTKAGLPAHWTEPLPIGWVGIARDSRTSHYWCATPPAPLPSCVGCRLWMTDWSLINACPAGDA